LASLLYGEVDIKRCKAVFSAASSPLNNVDALKEPGGLQENVDCYELGLTKKLRPTYGLSFYKYEHHTT